MNKFWLNSFGRLLFQNKINKFLFAEKLHRNIDKVAFIDDSRGFCEKTGEGSFSDFIQDEWIPISRDEFNMIKTSYREIELIRQAIIINEHWKKIS